MLRLFKVAALGIILVSFIACNLLKQSRGNHSLISPDGKTELHFILTSEAPQYSVRSHLTKLLDNSKLGFRFADGSVLQSNLKIDRQDPYYGL